jgi:hypothetical protein
MKLRDTNEYLQAIASYMMIGAVTAGLVMWIVPVQPSFDWRWVGAGLGALTALALFQRP